MLLSLHLLTETIHPIESSVVLKSLLAAIAPDPLILVLLALFWRGPLIRALRLCCSSCPWRLRA